MRLILKRDALNWNVQPVQKRLGRVNVLSFFRKLCFFFQCFRLLLCFPLLHQTTLTLDSITSRCSGNEPAALVKCVYKRPLAYCQCIGVYGWYSARLFTVLNLCCYNLLECLSLPFLALGFEGDLVKILEKLSSNKSLRYLNLGQNTKHAR